MMADTCELENIAKSVCETNGIEFVCFIDAGSYKETYQVKDAKGNLALKIFKPNNRNERTDREIDAMQRSHGKNIAQLIKVDFILLGKQRYLYLFEEYLAG